MKYDKLGCFGNKTPSPTPNRENGAVIAFRAKANRFGVSEPLFERVELELDTDDQEPFHRGLRRNSGEVPNTQDQTT